MLHMFQESIPGSLFDSIVCSCVSPEHVEQVIPCQLEVGQQSWRELPIQPSTESLHTLNGCHLNAP